MVITRGAWVVVVALVALVAACASPIAGAPQPAPPPSAQPGGGLPLTPAQQRLADLFAQVRSWDVCAMHDVDAAARVTGYAPDELLPYREPGTCRLVVRDPSGVSEWELQLDVFPVIPAEGAGEPLDVGGVRMPQVRDDSESRCAYSYPIGDPQEGDEPWGIELSVYHLAPDKAPCEVAREYATAIAPQLADPPLRAAGGTAPALDITASDPCALAAAMVPVMSDGTPLGPDALDVGDIGPYRCAVTASAGDGTRTRASVEFVLADADEVGSTVVGGFPGARNPLGIDCQALFAPQDVQLVGNPGTSPSVPVVEIDAGCDRIDALAAAAAGAVAPAAAARPREDALVLGDLDPPPTAEGVGAPFDPCTVVGGWDAYPPEVQPAIPRPAVPMPVRPEDPFQVGCRFNAGEMFSSLVWGTPTDDGFSADPAARGAGAVAVEFAGRPGVEQTSTNAGNGQPTCYSAVQLTHGIAAVVTTVPGDPCRVNRAVLEQVAGKVP